MSILDSLRTASARTLCRTIVGRQLWPKLDARIKTERFGTGYGGWDVTPNAVATGSVVYSCGVGNDISFDLGLIDRFGVTVHAFDPTPAAVSWMGDQKIPRGLFFHPWGIAAFDGVASFIAPADLGHVSYRITDRTEPGCVQAPVYRIGTIMRKLGHDRVDLLKLDIEGAEYAVLEDLLAEGLLVRQILVEFHHPGRAELQEAKATLRRLRSRGYQVIHISPTGREYTLLAAAMRQ